jgi:hypothetical protein
MKILKNLCDECFHSDPYQIDESGWPFCNVDQHHSATTQKLSCFEPRDVDLSNPICSCCGEELKTPDATFLIVKGADASDPDFLCSSACLVTWALDQANLLKGPSSENETK